MTMNLIKQTLMSLLSLVKLSPRRVLTFKHVTLESCSIESGPRFLYGSINDVSRHLLSLEMQIELIISIQVLMQGWRQR